MELLLVGPPLPNRLAKPGPARAPSPPVTPPHTQYRTSCALICSIFYSFCLNFYYFCLNSSKKTFREFPPKAIKKCSFYKTFWYFLFCVYASLFCIYTLHDLVNSSILCMWNYFIAVVITHQAHPVLSGQSAA